MGRTFDGKRWLRVLALGLIGVLSVLSQPSAATSDHGVRVDAAKQETALVSTEIDSLNVASGHGGAASGSVQLRWEGRIDRAYLVLSAEGAEAGHSIYVNERRVGSAPISAEVEPDRGGTWPAVVQLAIPWEILGQGENVITITNDADEQDGWSALKVYIEIHGQLAGPPVAVLGMEKAEGTDLGINATSPISGSVVLPSSYELAQGRSISQVVWYQIPTDYDGSTATTMLVAIHGMGETGEGIRDFLATEADSRGWLLVAPDMHGRYYINTGQNALGWVGAQHDSMDAVAYMLSHYHVDRSRIYVAGRSMGGQTASLIAMKYPDVFAGAATWKPFTDLTDWYYELKIQGNPADIVTKIENETGGTPSTVLFQYELRSPMEMVRNPRQVPFRMWHDVDDELVPIHHSRDLRDGLNVWNPDTAATLIEIPSSGYSCSPGLYEHCYDPPPADVFDFLSGLSQAPSPSAEVLVRSDESKPYYWLTMEQTGGSHWSEIGASWTLAGQQVTVTITDSHPITVGLNVGSVPITDTWDVSRAGIGWTATTYLVRGPGQYRLAEYDSGYLTLPIATTGLSEWFVSAVSVQASVDSSVVLANPVATTTVRVVAEDAAGNPVPDGTAVTYQSTQGSFPNGQASYAGTATGGQSETVLTLGPTADLATVTVWVGSTSDQTEVEVLHSELNLQVTPDKSGIYAGQLVTLSYTVTNTGDVALTGVGVVDDNGTPGDSGDDITVCSGITLSPSQDTTCVRTATLYQTTTIEATASGLDPLAVSVTDTDTTTVNSIAPAISLSAESSPSTVHAGQTATYTYHVTNTGDVTLTGVRVVDDNGTPGDGGDDVTVCSGLTLLASHSATCVRTTTLAQTTSMAATAIGIDPWGGSVSDTDGTIVNTISPTILLSIKPSPSTVFPGQVVTYTYDVTNTGDVELKNVSVVDDNGTPGSGGDDVIVCSWLTLAPAQTKTCVRSVTLAQTTTTVATASGIDPLGDTVSHQHTAVVQVSAWIRIYLPLTVRN